MSQQAINKLLAQPWELLHKQLTQQAEQAILKSINEWQLDTTRTKPLKHRVRMKFQEATVVVAIDAPPGYETLSDHRLSLGVPREGSWSVTLEGRYRGGIKLWLGVRPTLPFQGRQTVKISTVRITADFTLDNTDDQRPRLNQFPMLRTTLRVELSGSVRLSPLDLVIELRDFRKAEDGTLRLEKEFADLRPRFESSEGTSNERLNGRLLVTLLPTITLGFDGRLSVRALGIRITVPIKFTIHTGMTLPPAVRELMNAIESSSLPRDWGEEPPLEDVEPLPETTDFLAAALEIEEKMLPHIPHGLVYGIRYKTAPDGSPTSRPHSYQGEEDTAIWTGHYLAAEAFRYAAAPTPAARAAALKRMQDALDGIRKLFRVAQEKDKPYVPGLLARAALPGNSKLQTDPPMNNPPDDKKEDYYGPVKLDDGKIWYGYGRRLTPPSRDSYIGVMMGLAYAYRLVDDEAVKSLSRQLVTEVLDFLLNNRWNVPVRDQIQTTFLHSFHKQLAFLRIGKTVNPERFAATYNEVASAAEYAWIPAWFSCFDPINQYYKFNLAHAAMGVLLFLEDDPALRASTMKAFRMLQRTVGHHRNAYFNLVRMLVESPADALAEETRALLREWLLRRESVAGPNSLPTEKTPDPTYLSNLYPDQAVEYVPLFPPTGKEEEFMKRTWKISSLHALPVHKRAGAGMDFIWQRSPFSTGLRVKPQSTEEVGVDKGNPEIEGPAVDYLLAVWMAAYLKVI